MGAAANDAEVSLKDFQTIVRKRVQDLSKWDMTLLGGIAAMRPLLCKLGDTLFVELQPDRTTALAVLSRTDLEVSMPLNLFNLFSSPLLQNRVLIWLMKHGIAADLSCRVAGRFCTSILPSIAVMQQDVLRATIKGVQYLLSECVSAPESDWHLTEWTWTEYEIKIETRMACLRFLKEKIIFTEVNEAILGAQVYIHLGGSHWAVQVDSCCSVLQEAPVRKGKQRQETTVCDGGPFQIDASCFMHQHILMWTAAYLGWDGVDDCIPIVLCLDKHGQSRPAHTQESVTDQLSYHARKPSFPLNLFVFEEDPMQRALFFRGRSFIVLLLKARAAAISQAPGSSDGSFEELIVHAALVKLQWSKVDPSEPREHAEARRGGTKIAEPELASAERSDTIAPAQAVAKATGEDYHLKKRGNGVAMISVSLSHGDIRAATA